MRGRFGGATVTVESMSSWWFAPVPARRLDLVRAATFGYAVLWLIVRVRYVWDVAGLPARRFHPVGVLTWFDSQPSRTAIMLVWGLAVCGSLLAACGRAVRFSASIGSLAMLVIATFTSSFGQVFHTEHLLVLHLLVLAVFVVVDTSAGQDERTGWALSLMMAIVVVSYVVAGLAKLRFSGADWLTGDVLRNWVAADNLRKLLLNDFHSPLGGWLAGVEWIWPPVAALTLMVELGAPIALTSGRARLLWLAVAWSFHVGVFVIMAITFPYQLTGVAYLAFLPVERIETWARQFFSSRRRVGFGRLGTVGSDQR